MEESTEKLTCPVCKTNNTEEKATYESNGIFGPGCRTYKTSSYWVCNECGVMFQPVKKKE